MHIILLSGGSGKRLWPLSNDIRSKQFIKIFENDGGTYESMIQRVYRQITAAVPNAQITIATSKSQVSSIINQIGVHVQICIEPSRRDTFPAIALAAAHLRDEQGAAEDEPVVVCPVDPYVAPAFFESVHTLGTLAAQGLANLILMGIQPTYPSEKYGYILPSSGSDVGSVDAFKEKPDAKTAQTYIDQGALWNSGVFAFRLGYILQKAKEQLAFTDYADLFSRYDSLAKKSFDYAVSENEKSIAVMRFSGQWKDLGTWNTLTEEMSAATFGNVICDDACTDVKVVNELNTPILCAGVNNLIVAAGPQGVLVSTKDASSHIKPYVDAIDQQVMFAEKSWGQYLVIDIEDESQTVKVTLQPNNRMHYHSHNNRKEVWSVVSGQGRVILDGKETRIAPGDVITIPIGCKHTVIADTTLKIIEVQLGKDISVSDKVKHDLT